MSPPAGQRKCSCCKQFFLPDLRNRHHQEFCSQPPCQRASHRESQRRWLAKPANQDHFRGPAHVERVRQWRAAHPGYWKRARKSPAPLQDVCHTQIPPLQPLPPPPLPDLLPPPLQDLSQAQLPLLLGLVSQITHTTLQEDIAAVARRLIAKGQDLLDTPSRRSGHPHPGYDR